MTITHRMSYKHPLYRTWLGMRERCMSSTCKIYRYYGGKGIKICDRWNDFVKFAEDMGDKPSPKHSLDRIDSSGDYSPENCRWATGLEQHNNRTNNIVLEFRGESKTIAQWARILGFKESAIRQRIQNGWDVDLAFTKPVKTFKRRNVGVHAQ